MLGNVFCINLPRRPDRWLRTREQFRRVGLTVKRLAAPDAVAVTEARGWRNKGIRACALAHRLAWREGRRAGAEAVLVFEDDVILCPGFKERLEAVITALPEDWMVCHLGCVFRSPPVDLGGGLLRVTGKTWDAHAYLIRRPFWEVMHQEFAKVSRRTYKNPARGQGPAAEERANDTIMAEFHDRFPAYSVWPPMAWQARGLSNNENSVRGNYLPDGTQAFMREMIRHLPGVAPETVKVAGKTHVAAAAGIKETGTFPDPPAVPAISAEQRTPEPLFLRTPRRDPGRFRAAGRERGILISPYSAESERMAFALARSLRKYNAEIPVQVVAQDYVCGLDWRGLARVKSARAAEAHGTIYQWFNKLSALTRSPFEETLYLDCDIVFVDDPADWFDRLATDDFTWFQRPLKAAETPDETRYNFVNPHRMREEFGVESVPVIDGSGHFFLRRSDRGHALVRKVVELMAEAVDEPEKSLYRRMTGQGNVPASDEAAASIVAVREGITLPLPAEECHRPLGTYLPPHQKDGIFDFEEGIAQYTDACTGAVVIPQAMHFCWTGKSHPAYQRWIRKCLSDKPSRLVLAG